MNAWGAGTASIGGGMLVAGVALLLPEGLAKNLVILLAPPTTLAVRQLWIWAHGPIVDYARNWTVESRYQAAVKSIDEALKNEALGPARRAESQNERVELDVEMVAYRRSRTTFKTD